MKRIGYLRVSTEDQKLGAAAQLASIKKFGGCAFYFEETVSGAADLDKRPKLLEAISALQGGDVLVVAKRDRLSRCTVTNGIIEHMVSKKGASIESADGVGNGTGAESALMRDIVMAMAKYERAIIIIRTLAALREKRVRSEKTGGCRPFGFDIEETDGVLRLVRCQMEQDAIAEMVDLREGGLSYERIAEELRVWGIETVNGGKWQANTVRRILIRAKGEQDES